MSEPRSIGLRDFDEVRIDDIVSGRVPMTAFERDFLCSDTARFEECQHTEAELRVMSDKDLMNTAYWVWAEYASGQI